MTEFDEAFTGEFIPPPAPRARSRAEPEIPVLPDWPFDEQKLTRLLERRTQNFASIRDLSGRRNEARSARNQLRDQVREVRRNGRNPSTATLQALAYAEAKLRNLNEEYEGLQERVESENAIAANCEEWGRERGWARDGRRGGSGGWEVANGPGSE